jgi:hypothetical protein
MRDARDTTAKNEAPRLLVTRSFMAAAQAGCDAADRLRGGVEVGWSLYGQWKKADDERFGEIYVTHPFMLKADCGTAWFRVKPADLSALGRRVSESHSHLVVLGQAHRHPGTYRPLPSPTDEDDRDQMARLLKDCAEKEIVEHWEVPPAVPPARATGAAKRILKYAIDPQLEIRIWPRPRKNRRRTPAGPVRRIARAASVMCTKRVGLSYQAFLVFNKTADCDAIYAQVMEFRRLPFGEDATTLFDDNPVEVVPDAEVADRLGIDVSLVRCDVDQERIDETVKDCVQAYHPATTYSSSYSYTSSGHVSNGNGSNGTSRSRDSYEIDIDDIDGGWEKGRFNG